MDVMNIKEVIQGAFARHADVLQKTKGIETDIERGAALFLKTAKEGRRLFVCGNGGSAADSEHIVGEWLCRYKKERGPLSAVALASDAAALTAIGNDYGFEYVFSRQIEALGREGDLLLALTTSGASKNILEAVLQAKKNGMSVIVLTGARGKNIQGADVVVAVPSEETARIQEMHEIIYHSWCEYIDDALAA